GMIDAARTLVGEQAKHRDERVMGSEDFADMLAVVPGAYCTIGHKGDVPLHNPGFVFDDEALPTGAALMATMVERRGAA
ncbi:MAG: M20/M25/M40 family metallo-hydrolase, partial [Pseudomonadota bacterium]